eukprot:7033158-Karenia_brevis.AAC.2
MAPHTATGHPEMAPVKLIKSSIRPPQHMSSSTGAARCNCPPFSQAEMAALKLISRQAIGCCCALHRAMAPHAPQYILLAS